MSDCYAYLKSLDKNRSKENNVKPPRYENDKDGLFDPRTRTYYDGARIRSIRKYDPQKIGEPQEAEFWTFVDFEYLRRGRL